MCSAVTETVAQMCLERGGWTLQNLFSFKDAVELTVPDGGPLDEEITYDSYVRWSKSLTISDWNEALQYGWAASEDGAAGICQQIKAKISARQ